MVKKGDTLIEVAIAVGIFSMIAISVVSVISSSTSGAQLALETTLAREEVDTQAETLRFVHNAYISNKDDKDDSLYKLWKTITNNAITLNNDGTETGKAADAAILQYSPQTCEEIYNSEDNPIYNHAFVLDPRELQNGMSAYKTMNSGMLQYAKTYPHLKYSQNEQDLFSTGENLYSAEGIYVIAVKDPGSTNIAGTSTSTSAYYDFYIRTCWYGTGNEEPSTISTVMRLHDPDIILNNE